MMIDKGIIEIDGKRTEVAKEDIRKLKFILDELRIMHIIDGVLFCETIHVTGHKKALYDIGGFEAQNNDRVPLENLFRYQQKIQFRELKIPDFCLLDLNSLTQLDDEQAEFLGNLVYGA